MSRKILKRIIMKTKMTKLVAAVAVIIAVLVGLEFIGEPSKSGLAFAKVLEHIHSLSYTFDLTTVTEKQASNTVQAMVLEPGRMRVDATVGLGKISSVIDTAEGKSIILFHQFKAAQVHDMTSMVQDYGAEGILFLCTKSIENLWDMRDGTEEELGEKEIEGQTAVGFKVLQEGQYIRSETTIWAHAETAVPILVEMIMTPPEDSPEQMKFIMNNFKLDVELDEELFSMAVPPGYTLAYQLDLDELEKKTEQSDEAEQIVQALEIWSQGKKTKAVEILLKIDWTQPIKFSKQPYLFSITEKEYVSLKPKDQQKVMEEVMGMSSTVRQIVREVLSLGEAAMLAQDYEKAERYFETTLQLGRLLTRNLDSMLIVRLVGIAVERKTLTQMTNLYTATGQQKKLEAVKKENQAKEAELQKIKNEARGL